MPRKIKRPVAKSPADDPQQFLVYRMEQEVIGARNHMRMSNKAIRTLLDSLCKTYNVGPIALKFEDLGRYAGWYETPPARMTLNKSPGISRDMLTITHEFAHHLHWCLAGDKIEDHQVHGPQFVACHMSVLDTIRYIPIYAMKVICDKYGIKYCDPGTGRSLASLLKVLRRRESPSRRQRK